MQWSSHQKAVFSFVQSNSGNAIVTAVAGSGKTTTIVEAINRIKEGNNIFLAFNKSIADELKNRGVNARTFHSLTFSPVTKFKKTRKITANKIFTIIDDNLTGKEADIYGPFLRRMISLGKQVGISCLQPDTEQAWLDIMNQYDIDLNTEKASLNRALQLCSELLHKSNQSHLVDFDDLLYLAVKHGLSLPTFDFVFVDEAQDTNAIQRALLRKIMTDNSRMVAVGDPAQAIYGFRGADSDSMNRIADEFNCESLPLTISYRCPKAVVNYAQTYVSHIESTESAPEGAVTAIDKVDLSVFKAKDLVVCRTTKPVIALAFKLLKNNIPAQVMGREIGQNIKNLVKQVAGKTTKDLDTLLDKLETWRDREEQKAIAKNNEAKAEQINDKADTIICLIDGLAEEDYTIAGLNKAIDNLFSNKTNAVNLSTIHKAKGLEADRVFWLNSSKCPASWAKLEWQQEQERNLCYVAITRAKSELFLIEDKNIQ